MSQTKYTSNLLQKVDLSNYKPVTTLISLKLPTDSNDQQPYSDPTHDKHLASSLQYLTITRPEIAFVVNLICQQMHNPLNCHYHKIKRVLRYLQENLGLPLSPGDLNLHTYIDSDWVGNPTDRRSTSGYITYLGNTPISWHVHKQQIVAHSSIEAEYRALSSVTTDLIWLQCLVQEFNIIIPILHLSTVTTHQPLPLLTTQSSMPILNMWMLIITF